MIRRMRDPTASETIDRHIVYVESEDPECFVPDPDHCHDVPAAEGQDARAYIDEQFRGLREITYRALPLRRRA